MLANCSRSHTFHRSVSWYRTTRHFPHVGFVSSRKCVPDSTSKNGGREVCYFTSQKRSTRPCLRLQQRISPAAEPEDAIAGCMDGTMDCDSHPQPGRFPSRALCPKGLIANAPTTAHEPPLPQLTKTQKRHRQTARKLQTQTRTRSNHQGGT